MQTLELPNSDACWALLERIASSAQLKRSARLQELLFYVGKRSLQDGCDRIQEQEIGSKVFHRADLYDTNADNIVRTNVSDLRKRIEIYFNSEGSHEALTMEIPRGSYVPVFRFRAQRMENPAENTIAPQATTALGQPAIGETPTTPTNAHWKPMALAIVVVLIGLFGAGFIYFWIQYRALHQPLYGWQSEPSVAELWSRLLNANSNTDIVISDTGIGLAEALSRKAFSLNDYLSRSYIGQLQSDEMSPDMHAAVKRVLSWNLANPDEFVLARRLLALDPLGRNMHLYNASNYMPELAKRDNVILIGARKSNPWDELFDNRMNFITDFDSPKVVNRSPIKGEQPMYIPTGMDGYCIIAYMPKPDHSGMVMLIEGTNAEATEAAGDFLLSEDQLSDFKKILHVTKLPHFQVLLKISSVRGTPFTATVQAYRASTDTH